MEYNCVNLKQLLMESVVAVGGSVATWCWFLNLQLKSESDHFSTLAEACFCQHVCCVLANPRFRVLFKKK